MTGKPRARKSEYVAAHQRLEKIRGKASEHTCSDCGKQAHDWSYKEPTGFSWNPEDYIPRCRSCHKKVDYTEEQRAASRRNVHIAFAAQTPESQTRAGSSRSMAKVEAARRNAAKARASTTIEQRQEWGSRGGRLRTNTVRDSNGRFITDSSTKEL